MSVCKESIHLPIHQLKSEAQAGTVFYLHKIIPVGPDGKGAMLKPNSQLGLSILESLEQIHGEDFVLTVGHDPISGDIVDASGPGSRAGLMTRIYDFLREQSVANISSLFINKSTVIMGARKAEALIPGAATTPLEHLVQDTIEPLRNKRSNNIPGTMLTRAMADVLCSLYLEEISLKKQQKSSGQTAAEMLAPVIAAALLKDLSLASVCSLPPDRELDRPSLHPQLTVHLLQGGESAVTAADLEPKPDQFKKDDLQVANAYRIILDHENPLTRSKLAQILIRGCVFCRFLIQRGQDGDPLPREILQKAGYFDALELKHYLPLAVLCQHEKVKAILGGQLKTNFAMKSAMFAKYALSNHLPYPFDNSEALDDAMFDFFSMLPGFHKLSYQLLRHYVLHENELARTVPAQSERKRRMAQYEERIRNILF